MLDYLVVDSVDGCLLVPIEPFYKSLRRPKHAVNGFEPVSPPYILVPVPSTMKHVFLTRRLSFKGLSHFWISFHFVSEWTR